MKKSMCCNEDMIFLGKNEHSNMIKLELTPMYYYCCCKCGKLEWEMPIDKREPSKYVWYKYDKNKLKQLLKMRWNNE